MPVRRQVFRIEENARVRVRPAAQAQASDTDVVRELRALRDLIVPIVPRDLAARAQTEAARDFQRELESIHAAVRRARSEMESGAIGDLPGCRLAQELDAIVSGTERATSAILKSAEAIEQAAQMLSAAMKSDHERGLAGDIRDQAARIFEACNFQDIAGQRVGKVTDAVGALEAHAARLMLAWNVVERGERETPASAADDDRRFLNGPRLDSEPGHYSQDQVDIIFGS